MNHVIVVGGGAAGMMAAIQAAGNGARVTLLEKNEKLGKKLFITGKGRCNLTNACDTEELFDACLSNPKFLYSGFYTFSNQDTLEFFHGLGLKTKVERGNRVFPVSNHSSDVIGALSRELARLKVNVRLNTPVSDIITRDGAFYGVKLESGKILTADACIIATGGKSYPSTGSTGDGYTWAEKLGHTIRELSPGLVPFETAEPWVTDLQGLSLRNVQVTILDGKKVLFREFGEMLFTHFGVSGPCLITASSKVGRKLKEHPLTLKIDLKPALTEEQLDQRLLRDFGNNQKKQFKNSLGELLPQKLIPVIVSLSNIPEDLPVHSISREERKKFVLLLKNLTMTLTALRGFEEAIITTGGVKVKEIDPHTMESRLVRNLYFAGEILDLDAVTGGFNLQIAWSTGYLAGTGSAGTEDF